MFVHGGIGSAISIEEAGSAAHMREVYGSLKSLRTSMRSAACIKIPAGQAFIIIGGRASIYDELSSYQFQKIKFLAEDASGIVVTAHRAGSKVNSASRFLGRSLGIGLMVASLPTGIPALLKKGSTSATYAKGLKSFKQVAKNPYMVTDAGKTVTYTVIQIMGRGGAHPDEVLSSDIPDIYIKNLFNALLSARAIKFRKTKNRGGGGGVINFGDDDGDDDGPSGGAVNFGDDDVDDADEL